MAVTRRVQSFAVCPYNRTPNGTIHWRAHKLLFIDIRRVDFSVVQGLATATCTLEAKESSQLTSAEFRRVTVCLDVSALLTLPYP